MKQINRVVVSLVALRVDGVYEPCKHCLNNHTWLLMYMWPGMQKLTMWAQKNRRFFLSLLYHNLQTICNNKLKTVPLLQNLMGFLLKFTEVACHIHTEDIIENITWCNLRSHGWFMQARSHICSNSLDIIVSVTGGNCMSMQWRTCILY